MKKVVTVCPYCASGCKINLVVDNGKIVRAEAAQGKTNQGTLCLKGYYGWVHAISRTPSSESGAIACGDLRIAILR